MPEFVFWWMSPRRDEHYQWWFGYEKVRMKVCADSVKQAYLEKMNNV